MPGAVIFGSPAARRACEEHACEARGRRIQFRPASVFRGSRAAASTRPKRRIGMKKFLYILAAVAVFMAVPSLAMAQTGGKPVADQQAFDTARSVAGARGIWLAGASIGAGLAVIGAG